MASLKTTKDGQLVSMRDGGNIFVKLIGENQNVMRKKPLLIAVHGAPGASNHEESLISYSFLQDDFRILVFDGRGSGASDLKGPFTLAQWIEDVEELRQWAGAETFILGGGSHGGCIALSYALKHGDKLQALILRDTFADGPLNLKNITHLALTSTRIVVDGDRQRRLWSGNLRDDEDYLAGLSEIVPLFPANDSSNFKVEGSSAAPQFHHATFNEAFGRDLPTFNIVNELERIKVPTLVVVGRHDLICPVQFSEVISEKIQGAKLCIAENSGHSPPEEQPEEWKKFVTQFLTQQGLIQT